MDFEIEKDKEKVVDVETDKLISTLIEVREKSLQAEEQDQQIKLMVQSKKGSNFQSDHYIEYKYRWVIVLSYTLMTLAPLFCLNTFTPIILQIQDIYGKSKFMATIPSLLFFLAQPIASVPVNFILDTYGLKIGVSIGESLIIIGCATRLLVNKSYYFMLLGQVFLGLGSPFITYAPSKVSATWFKPKNRAPFTSLFSFMIVVSGPMGNMIGPMFVKDSKKSKDDVFNLLLFEALCLTGIMLQGFVLFRNKPLTPPSFAASVKKESFSTAIRSLAKNRNYIFIIIGFGLYMGDVNGFFTSIQTMLTPFNMAKYTSFLSILATVFGIVGLVATGVYTKKKKQFRKVLLICLSMGAVCFAIFIATLYNEQKYLSLVAVSLVGFALYPVVPNLIELACEIVFPVGEATATGFIFSMGQLMSFTLGLLYPLILDEHQKKKELWCLLIQLGVFILSFLIILQSKQKLNRLQSEVTHQIESIKGSIHGEISSTERNRIIKQDLKDEGIL